MFRIESHILTVVLMLASISVGHVFAAGGNPFELLHAHSLQKVGTELSGVENLERVSEVVVDVAGNEAESFQLVVRSFDADLKGVDVKVVWPEALNDSMEILWHKVGYVQTGNPSYATGHVGWWPDPLMPAGPFDVESNKLQPLWFTVHVSPAAKPGTYQASVEVTAGEYSETVPVLIRVRNFALPRPGRFAAPFGLYAPYMSNWYYGDKEYGQHFTAGQYAKWCRFMGKYRLTPKNIAYEFVDREYTEGRNGKTLKSVDFENLESTVGALAGDYYPPYSFGIYRLSSAKEIGKWLKAGKTSAKEMARTVILHIKEWEKRGFPAEVYVYGFDELVGDDKAVVEFAIKVYSALKKEMPSIKIMQTSMGKVSAELTGLVDIWCPKTASLADPFYKSELGKGKTLWSYVCVSPVPPFANFFIDQPATDHRVLFWQMRKAGATGLLYWSTTWWEGFSATPASSEPCFPDIPMKMKEHEVYTGIGSLHVNGDGLLLYPGKDMTPLPSIRLEIIRDGIEDVEYMFLLEELIGKVEAIPVYQTHSGALLLKHAKTLLEVPGEISRSLEDYTKDPQVILERRKELSNMIEQLVDILENKDYETWKKKDQWW
ncbi:MAG: glycoside hydrolase domain-containing protein [Verrucomicrobiota bacterium]